MDPADLHIRRASAADLLALSSVASRTFRDTFGRQNTPDDMRQYLKLAFSPAQLQTELEDPACTFLLVFADSGHQPTEPIGYAKLVSGDVDPSVEGPEPLELARLYVDRTVLGQGVGAALMRACLEAAVAEGRRTLWLGVWEENPAAIEFYRRWGFTRVGTHEFLLGSDRQIDIIMERSLETQSGGDTRDPKR